MRSPFFTSPGQVDVVALVYDFLRSRTRLGDPLAAGESEERCALVTRDDNVRCSAFEVE